MKNHILPDWDSQEMTWFERGVVIGIGLQTILFIIMYSIIKVIG
jgi:hypothetical protein